MACLPRKQYIIMLRITACQAYLEGLQWRGFGEFGGRVSTSDVRLNLLDYGRALKANICP